MAFEMEIILIKRPIGYLSAKYSEKGPLLTFQVVPSDKHVGESMRFAARVAVDANEVTLVDDITFAMAGYGVLLK